MFFDPLWLVFAIPGLLLGIWAQIKLSHAYGKYSQVPVDSGMTGAEAAREILDQRRPPQRAGGGNSRPFERPLRPDETRAVFVVGQFSRPDAWRRSAWRRMKSGHALQHQAAYGLFNVRMALVPVTHFASMAYMGIFFVGLYFQHVVRHLHCHRHRAFSR